MMKKEISREDKIAEIEHIEGFSCKATNVIKMSTLVTKINRMKESLRVTEDVKKLDEEILSIIVTASQLKLVSYKSMENSGFIKRIANDYGRAASYVINTPHKLSTKDIRIEALKHVFNRTKRALNIIKAPNGYTRPGAC